MKQKFKRAFVVVLAIGVVTGGFTPVTTVSADHDCSNVNKATWFAFSGPSVVGELTGGSGVGCDMWHEDTSVDEIRESEANQTKVDLYSSANGVKANQETFGAVYDNYLNDTESIAWQKAEAAIAQSYENGDSKAQAKVAAQEAIAEYYTAKQVNLIEQWNTSVHSMGYLDQRARQENEVGNNFVRHLIAENVGSDVDEHRITSWGGNNDTVTLANGSTYGVTEIQVHMHYCCQDTRTAWIGPNDGAEYGLGSGSAKNLDAMGAGINEPNDNYEKMEVINFNTYKNRWDKINTKQNNLNSETDTFVNGTWQDFQDGNIDSSDVISRTTLMFEYGSKSANGSGNMYDVIGALANMGLDTPRMNQTGMMQVSIPEAGITYEGMLFARNAPNGTWKVGETYNPDNISGPVMMATTDGDMKDINRNFTIDSATDTEGNEIDTVETTSYNYQTADTSEMNQKYSELLALTQEIEERQDELYAEQDSDDSGASLGEQKWYQQLVTEYFGIPMWGYIVTLTIVAYIANAVRKD